MEALAIGAALLLAGVAVFQAALALGAPWGEMAYGGRVETTDGVLSGRHRASSAFSFFVLLFAAWVILARGDVVSEGFLSDGFVRAASWVVASLSSPEHGHERHGSHISRALGNGLGHRHRRGAQLHSGSELGNSTPPSPNARRCHQEEPSGPPHSGALSWSQTPARYSSNVRRPFFVNLWQFSNAHRRI